MSLIPKSFINDLVARTDLGDLIGSRVTLKRAGSSLKGLCPFHDEKTPSFTVSPDKGFYKCYGCGAYGNAIDFIREYENREFVEAIEILAEMHNVEIPVERSNEPKEETQVLFELMREADQFYRQQLRETPEAIAYLKSRGIDGATAGQFALGFAPDAWSALLEHFGGDKAPVEQLIRAGLVVRNENGRTYDRFRHRIMFPIRDGRGRVIGFGGRMLEKGEPKYLNSPETPLFDKSRTLYGLYEARQKPGRPDRIVVVEGYVDVIALDQFDAGPALATMGTAATAENMRHLTRLSDRVVFCFDGDRAGREAAWRAVETVLPFGGGKVAIQFVLLPEGEDPDSFVRERGAEAFEQLLAEAVPLASFMISEAGRDLDLAHADGRGKLITTVQPLLERLPDGHYRDLVISQLAETCALAPDKIEQRLAGSKPANNQPPPAAPRQAAQPGRSRMRAVMTFILHYPSAVRAAGPVLGIEEFDAPGADLLRQLLEIAGQDPGLRTGQFIEQFSEETERSWVRQLAAAEPEPIESDEQAPQFLRDSLELLLADHRKLATVEAIRRAGQAKKTAS